MKKGSKQTRTAKSCSSSRTSAKASASNDMGFENKATKAKATSKKSSK